MGGLNGERLPIQIHMEKAKGPNNVKALLLNRGIPGLPG